MMSTAAAATAWVGVLLQELGHVHPELKDWQNHLSNNRALMYQNSDKSWTFVLAGHEISQPSLPKYLALAYQLFQRKVLLTQQLALEGTQLYLLYFTLMRQCKCAPMYLMVLSMTQYCICFGIASMGRLACANVPTWAP